MRNANDLTTARTNPRCAPARDESCNQSQPQIRATRRIAGMSRITSLLHGAMVPRPAPRKRIAEHNSAITQSRDRASRQALTSSARQPRRRQRRDWPSRSRSPALSTPAPVLLRANRSDGSSIFVIDDEDNSGSSYCNCEALASVKLTVFKLDDGVVAISTSGIYRREEDLWEVPDSWLM